MAWRFIDQFAVSSSACLWIFFTFRGYLTLTAVFLTAFYCWRTASNWWSQRARLIKFASTLPGPRLLPIIGNALEFACESEDILERVVHICLGYDSPFRIWLGPKLFIVVTDPRDYEIILGSGKAAYKDTVYRLMEPFVGQGLVSGSGSTHKAHRKIIMPMLNGKTLSVCLKYFDRHSRICADLLEKEVDAGEFDVSSYMANCTVDIMLDTIMGTSGNTQRHGDKSLVYWNERMYEIVHARMMKVWLHYDTLFSLTRLSKLQNKGMNVIHSFVDNVVARKKDEHCALKRDAAELERPRVMLLEQIISHVAEAGDMDDVEIRNEIYTLFTASQDTTSVIASFAFMMLAMHPQIQEKVRKEVNEVIGHENVTDEHVPHLKYLEMVIRETVRLFPIAPLMVRQLKGDVKLDSCTLPEGCSVVMVPFVTHRNPKYWAEPDKFMPERFLHENSKGRHQYANVSFSGGLRGCIGQKFAIMCLKTIIANVIRRYRLSSTEKLETLRLKTDISIRSRNSYKVSLTKI